MKKRILSAFLVLCMMLTMVPTAALAAEDLAAATGATGSTQRATTVSWWTRRSTMMRTEIIP